MERNELAKIIYESLEQLRWFDIAKGLADRVLRLDVGVPVLVAWEKWSLWVLVSIDEFKIAKLNFNLIIKINLRF